MRRAGIEFPGRLDIPQRLRQPTSEVKKPEQRKLLHHPEVVRRLVCLTKTVPARASWARHPRPSRFLFTVERFRHGQALCRRPAMNRAMRAGGRRVDLGQAFPKHVALRSV